jgi:hypothetical protein
MLLEAPEVALHTLQAKTPPLFPQDGGQGGLLQAVQLAAQVGSSPLVKALPQQLGQPGARGWALQKQIGQQRQELAGRQLEPPPLHPDLGWPQQPYFDHQLLW